MYVCMYVCMYVRTYVRISVFASIHVLATVPFTKGPLSFRWMSWKVWRGPGLRFLKGGTEALHEPGVKAPMKRIIQEFFRGLIQGLLGFLQYKEC